AERLHELFRCVSDRQLQLIVVAAQTKNPGSREPGFFSWWKRLTNSSVAIDQIRPRSHFGDIMKQSKLTRLTFKRVGLPLAFALALVAMQSSAAPNGVHGAVQSQHVPSAVTQGAAAPVDQLDSQQHLQLALSLPERNGAELDQLLHDLQD